MPCCILRLFVNVCFVVVITCRIYCTFCSDLLSQQQGSIAARCAGLALLRLAYYAFFASLARFLNHRLLMSLCIQSTTHMPASSVGYPKSPTA